MLDNLMFVDPDADYLYRKRYVVILRLPDKMQPLLDLVTESGTLFVDSDYTFDRYLIQGNDLNPCTMII